MKVTEPTRVWAVIQDGTPGGRPVEMVRTRTGWTADLGVHGETVRYTALIDGKFVDYPPGEVTG